MTESRSAPKLVGSAGASLREEFGIHLCELAAIRSDFVVFDADVAGGTGTHHFRNAFPDRFYQFGIAEQNMFAAAAGFASVGLIPVVTTFAVFCLRALEQIRLSIGYASANVKIVASHPGLDVGPDGGSAQALEDLAVFRAIPGFTVVSPADALETRQATEAILEMQGPAYMRTGRSPAPDCLGPEYQFELGKGRVLLDGSDVTIVASGVEVARALAASEILAKDGIHSLVANISTIKPLDRDFLVRCARSTGCFVTAEDHSQLGGLGGAVAEVLARHYPCPIEFVGVPDCFGESGEPEELSEKYGISSAAIVAAAKRAVHRKGELR